jgi:hypothetical protein
MGMVNSTRFQLPFMVDEDLIATSILLVHFFKKIYSFITE